MMAFLEQRVFGPLVAVTALAVVASLWLVFGHAPVEATMGIIQKIFYVHVPSAMAAYAGFTMASVASFLYLVRPHRTWDMLAVAGAEVGLLFCTYVLISGPLWAAVAWGKAWTWDPQLTATFILFLLYGGYVLLRAFSGEDERMRKIAAVLAVLAFVDIPVIHYAVRIWGGLHPVVEREGGGGLAPEMKLAFSVSMLAFLLVFALLSWMRFQVRWRQEQVNKLYLEVESLARARE